MFARSRSRVVLLLSLALGAGALVVWRKDKGHETKRMEGALQADASKQSLEALKPKLAALNTKFAALHKQVDPLPPNLQGFSDVRAKFYNTDIGLGVMGPKLTWLSDRVDAAQKSGNREELQQVSKDIARTHDEFAQIDRIAIEVLHQVLPFQRLAELQAKEASAGSASVPPAGQTGF